MMEKADALLQLQPSANNIYLLLKSNTQFIAQPSVETELHVHAIAQWLVLASYHEGPGSVPGQPMWKRDSRTGFFSKYFSFPLTIIIPPIHHTHSSIIWGVNNGSMRGHSSTKTFSCSSHENNILLFLVFISL